MTRKFRLTNFKKVIVLGFTLLNLSHSEDVTNAFSLFSTQNMSINDRSTVRGNIRSNTYIQLGIEAQLYNDMFCSGDILLKERSRPNGKVVAKGNITQPVQSYTGNRVFQQDVPTISIPFKTFPTGGQTINVWSGNTYILANGTYNEVNVYSNATLILCDGTYSMNSINFYSDAKIIATVDTGIIINTKNKFTFGDRSVVTLKGNQNPKKFTIYTSQTNQVTIGANTKFNMTLVAPNASIYVGSRAVVKGRLAAKSINIAPDVTITTIDDMRFVDTDNDNVPDSIEIQLGFNPNDPLKTPSLTMPSKWGVSPDTAAYNRLVVYTTPKGKTFEVKFPAGSVTSYHYPYIENLKTLPTGTPPPPPGEIVSCINQLYGQLSGDTTVEFTFSFDDHSLNIGSNSVNAYAFKSGVWERMDTKVSSQQMAVINVGEPALIILTLKDNVLLVNAAATSPSPDGKTWTTAFPTLTQAIAAAGSRAEIWVAQGTYYAGTSRNESFELKEIMNIIGGYSGTNNYYFDRDPEKYKTILSGDIGVAGNETDNTLHIIKCSWENTIDGFTICDGYADMSTPWYNTGAGILINYNDLIRTIRIKNCIFKNNCSFSIDPWDTRVGGGAAITASTSQHVLIDNCLFKDNTTLKKGLESTGYSTVGGAVFFDPTKDLNVCQISNSIFINNDASLGGAIYSNRGNIQNCVFTNNITYRGSTQRGKGGAIFGDNKIVNCTFAKNFSDSGGALFLGTISEVYEAKIINSILWHNDGSHGAEVYHTDWLVGSTVTFSNCCVEGGINGTKFYGEPVNDGGNNIATAPLFLNEDDADGQDNKLGTYDDGLTLKVNSPCFDAGLEETGIPMSECNTNTDIRGNGNDRLTGNVNESAKPDIGAYWLYLSEFISYRNIDFLAHEDHPYGFDRIVSPNTYYYTQAEIPQLYPDYLFISLAFGGQGADVPNNGRFRMVVDPRNIHTGKIAVYDPSTSLIKIKAPDGTLVNELSWGSSNENIYSFEIVAQNKPADLVGEYFHDELKVLDNSGNLLMA